MPKIKPLYDKVLLERLEAEEKTAGGIVLPDTAKEKPTQGRIVATGKGRLTDAGEQIAPGVTVGERVLFGSYAGTEVKSEGKKYLILDEGEILAVVDDKPWPRRASKPRKGGKKK
ncbi:MAG: co-chaperone GroES [Planctomycetota bacterium]